MTRMRTRRLLRWNPKRDKHREKDATTMATHFPNFSLENKVELHEHGIDGSHGTKKD